MIVIDRKTIGIVELARSVASLAELGHERAIVTREYLHSMVVGIGGQQETSMMVERQALRAVELAIGIACLLGANRELDSSISINKKRIVCHQSSNREREISTTRDARQCLPKPPKPPIKGDDVVEYKKHTKERHRRERPSNSNATSNERWADAATRRRGSKRTRERERERERERSKAAAA